MRRRLLQLPAHRALARRAADLELADQTRQLRGFLRQRMARGLLLGAARQVVGGGRNLPRSRLDRIGAAGHAAHGGLEFANRFVEIGLQLAIGVGNVRRHTVGEILRRKFRQSGADR